MRLIRTLYTQVTEDLLLLVLLCSFILLLIWVPSEFSTLPYRVEWNTIYILSGLMLLSKGLERSGALSRLGSLLLNRVKAERKLAYSLIVFSALLSAIVTNDVALFIVIPLTLGLQLVAKLPITKLIIFEALAVNAGSAASPIGNPQNLYLWQLSQDSFFTFLLRLLPISLWMLVIVLLMARIAFKNTPVEFSEYPVKTLFNQPLFYLSLAGYPLFLMLVEMGFAMAGLVLVTSVFLIGRREVLLTVDWKIILIFVLMFLVLSMLAELPLLERMTQGLLSLPGAEMTTGILLSQLISNVPATIFLAEFTDQWYLLAWGVNVGGFGFAIGSMANLIALRLGKARGIWIWFHLWSVPTLLFSSIGAYLLIKLIG